jgi:hypothetical protein
MINLDELNPIVKYLALAMMAPTEEEEGMNLEMAMLWGEDLSIETLKQYEREANKIAWQLMGEKA